MENDINVTGEKQTTNERLVVQSDMPAARKTQNTYNNNKVFISVLTMAVHTFTCS